MKINLLQVLFSVINAGAAIVGLAMGLHPLIIGFNTVVAVLCGFKALNG